MEQVLEVYGLDSAVVSRVVKASYVQKEFQPRKLNINTADEKELAAHPYLRKTAARSIVAYRFQHGEFKALVDLGKIHTLDPKTIEKAVWSCYQEEPVPFMGCTLHDIGAYPEPPIFHRIASILTRPPSVAQPGKTNLNMGFVLNRLLPKTNCKKCGKPTCLAFAVDLARKKATLEGCPILEQPEFAADRAALARLLE